MKALLTILAIVLIIALIGGIVLILSFNPNQYRAEIARRLSEAVGQPVDIGSISLSFRNGAAIQLDDLAIQNKFKAKRFFFILDLKPLLQKQIAVKQCLIDSPEVVIPEGGVSLNPPASSPQSQGASSGNLSSAGQGASPSFSAQFNIKRIDISNGRVYRNGFSGETPGNILLDNVRLVLTNVSLDSPIQFSGDADLFLGGRKKLTAEGVMLYRQGSVNFNLALDKSVSASGSLNGLFDMPSLQIAWKADALELDSFLSAEEKKAEYVAGRLSCAVNMSARGKEMDILKRTLTGAGTVRIEDGAIKNRNFLKENFERITQIPGLGLIFQINLGPRFDALLHSPDTAFQNLEAEIQIANERVFFQSFHLRHADYRIFLNGSAGFDHSIDFRGSLLIHTALGEALVKKVKELVYLSDNQSQLSIPFVYRGRFPGAIPQPNVGDLAARTISTIGTQLLEEGLSKLFGKPQESAVQ